MTQRKLFGLIPRKLGLGAEEFHDYYRHPHGTMGRHITTLRGYVQSHQIHTSRLGEDQASFDAVAELWLDNDEDVQDFRSEQIVRKYIIEDELNFVDMDRLTFFVGEEDVVTSGPRQNAGLHSGDEMWSPANRPTSVKILHFVATDGDLDWTRPEDKEIGIRLGALRHVRCRPSAAFHGGTPSFLGVHELWWPSRTIFHRAIDAAPGVFEAFIARAGKSTTMLVNAERWI